MQKQTQKPSSSKDIEENKYVAMLSYLWILFLIPLLMKQDSKFCQFHAKQGLVLFIGWMIVSLVCIVPFIGWLIGFFGSIFLLVLTIMGIVKSLNGELWKMPVLGEYADKFNI